MSPFSVCFISSTPYAVPLDPTNEKKFHALEGLGEMFVIGFSTTWRPRRFRSGASFFLLPLLPSAALRYVLLYVFGPVFALSLVARRNVDILVAQSPYEVFAGAWVKKLARLFGRRVVLIVESHGDFEVSPFLQHRILWPSLWRFLISRVSKFGLGHADALRAISNSTRQQLTAWSKGQPLEQFLTWTDIDVFLHAEEEREKVATGKLLYVGVLIPRKAVEVLIQAFSSITEDFPEAHVVILGQAENKEYAERLAKQARELGLTSRVTFMESLPQQGLAEQMARAEALVLPSVSEGLGRVVFEAMACGTLVIGSRVGGIAEMIEDGENGFLVPPGDTETLSERLRWVLSHPEESHEMGQRARAFAKRFFSTESYLNAYRRLFQQATKSVKGARNPALRRTHPTRSEPASRARLFERRLSTRRTRCESPLRST